MSGAEQPLTENKCNLPYQITAVKARTDLGDQEVPLCQKAMHFPCRAQSRCDPDMVFA